MSFFRGGFLCWGIVGIECVAMRFFKSPQTQNKRERLFGEGPKVSRVCFFFVRCARVYFR